MLRVLKQVTYSRGVTAVARALGVQELLRSAYFRLNAPNGKVRVSVAGISAEFYVKNPSELRRIEGPTCTTAVSSSERESLELLIRMLRPGDIVFDIGANIGIYSVLLAKAVGQGGRVFAFEPDSRNQARLAENILLNNLKNVQCFQKALGDEKQRAKLYLRKDDPCQSSLTTPQTPGEHLEEVVEVVEGDVLRAASDLPVPRVVKIDVEGHEHKVIKGLHRTLAEPACQLVCCEIHPHLLKDIAPQQLVQLLGSLGFVKVDVRQHGLVQYAIASKI